MRAIRKVTTYICTSCFSTFPSGPEARTHAKTAHKGARKALARRKRRPGETNAGKVLAAVQGGARSAHDIQKRTRIPLKRVHSFLTYLRKQGKIQGYGGDVRAKT